MDPRPRQKQLEKYRLYRKLVRLEVLSRRKVSRHVDLFGPIKFLKGHS